jgi:hypothetical protein
MEIRNPYTGERKLTPKGQELEAMRKALPKDISFATLTRAQKDQLLEYLLKKEGLI